MKHVLSLLLFILLCSSANANPLGLGVIIGAPTGFSGKYLLSKVNSIDGAIAWSFGDDHAIHFHGDYLWQKNNVFSESDAVIDLFYGIGARFISRDPPRGDDDDDTVRFGPRIPIGLRYMFREPRIEVFIEAALIFNLIPSTSVGLDVGLGGRYFF